MSDNKKVLNFQHNIGKKGERHWSIGTNKNKKIGKWENLEEK